MKPFDLTDAAGQTKRDLFAEDPVAAEAAYSPWLANKYFSYHVDSVLYANDMNSMPDLPKDMQFRYYLGALSSRRRFSKWFKPEEDEKLDAIMTRYGINRTRAREALKALRPEDVDALVNVVRSAEREGAGRIPRDRPKGS